MERTPYLIQRGQFKPIAFGEITGFDSLIQFDYMGSAEFEFGAMPKSLRRIAGAAANYSVSPSGMEAKDGRVLFVFCAPTDADEIKTWLACAAKRAVRTKESTHLPAALGIEPDAYGRRTDFWWDLDNDWLAWLDGKNTARVMRALEMLKARWAK